MKLFQVLAVSFVLLSGAVHGANYYVDPVSGSNANPGSLTQPWQTLAKVVYYQNADNRPAGWINLQPGDTVWLRGGTHSWTYTPYPSAPNEWWCAYFRTTSGSLGNPITIRAYPGETPILRPTAPSAALTRSAITVLQASHWKIDGLEIKETFNDPVRIEECNNLEIVRCNIHDSDGVVVNNFAAIHILSSTNIQAHHCRLWDNWDRTAEVNTDENNRQIVLFGGGNAHIHNCLIGFSQPPGSWSGNGIGYKHHATVLDGVVFEVNDCIFLNCGYSCESGSAHTRIHHNLMIDSGGIKFANIGEAEADLRDQLVEYNTLKLSLDSRTGGGLVYNPDDRDPDSFTDDALGNVAFRRNILLDPRRNTLSNDFNAIQLGLYFTPAYNLAQYYNPVIPAGRIVLDNNGYWNGSSDNTPVFASFGRGSDYGTRYSFAHWQASGFDGGSLLGNPQLDASFYPSNVAMQDRGRFANAPVYERWRYQNFTFLEVITEAISDPSSDPDGDGRSNSQELTDGTNPKVADGGAAIQITEFQARIVFSWSSQPGKLYRVEGSDNNSVWITVANSISASQGLTTTATVDFPIAVMRKFYRIVEQ